jgi:hypothetical protein
MPLSSNFKPMAMNGWSNTTTNAPTPANTAWAERLCDLPRDQHWAQAKMLDTLFEGEKPNDYSPDLKAPDPVG